MRHLSLKLAAVCVLLSACVTINVYFPAAAAEKAADQIINDVWGNDAAKTDKSNKRSELLERNSAQRILLAAAGAVLDLIVPAAHAQADLNVTTPVVKQLTASMSARHAELAKFYASGAVGLTRDGLVQVRDEAGIALPDRVVVRKLVAAENADRANLYREIANANGHPEWETDIRNTFAERWAEKASPGWYVQDQNGQWKQK